MNRPDHRANSAEIHAANRKAGWWTDLKTGLPKERNFGEMLALVHSELSECWEGYALNSLDRHLPTFLNWHIELADACIRVYDMLGGCFSDSRLFIEWRLDMPDSYTDFEDRMVFFHALLSRALEHYRKSDLETAQMYLYRFLDCAFEFAEESNFDLEHTIACKCAYNRDRLDHKISERMKDDGKKI